MLNQLLSSLVQKCSFASNVFTTQNVIQIHLVYLYKGILSILLARQKPKQTYFAKTYIHGSMITVEHFGYSSKRYTWQGNINK